ncbi:hypothetical protein [Campylobacter concisus]|jgi:hypothetical protein|uniref:Uncharacterized protein n=1 Tax=Campylobacter concisus TaxID=199 RepID=A0A2R4P369_9BACT|nr:hypothetical protein [Campylobacter concisus]AVX45127.1 hypothetical protein CCS77_2121 [Campylobacter concisus]
MRTLTIAQLKALLSMYDDDATIEFIFREPVVEIAYKEFSGGEYIRLTLDDLKGDKEKSIIKIMLSA